MLAAVVSTTESVLCNCYFADISFENWTEDRYQKRICENGT